MSTTTGTGMGAGSGRISPGPVRLAGRVVLATVYFLFARVLAEHGARGLVSEDWVPLVEQAMLAFLLLFGFASFGFLLDRQLEPVAAQGLPLRMGWQREAGMGVAVGWAVVVVCVLPLLYGGLMMSLSLSGSALGWLLADAAYFALATLVVELVFRGYGYQCAARVMGEWPAAVLFAILYAMLRTELPGANHTSAAVSIVLSLLLTLAYLRTRALWLPWGLHFGWVAARALLFGLPVNGTTSHSPVVQGEALGSLRLSGAEFGLDGSWLAFWVLLVALVVVYRVTRELDFVHNAPVLVAGGMAVDLDGAARQQHEAAMGAETPAAPGLVQILPAGPGAGTTAAAGLGLVGDEADDRLPES